MVTLRHSTAILAKLGTGIQVKDRLITGKDFFKLNIIVTILIKILSIARDVISSNENLSNGDATRHNMNQTYRKLPMNLYRAVNSADGMNDDSATAAALVAAQVAAETARKLEQENAKILEQARRREDELLSTIRQQQIELQRLQQAAALAQQKAKVN